MDGWNHYLRNLRPFEPEERHLQEDRATWGHQGTEVIFRVLRKGFEKLRMISFHAAHAFNVLQINSRKSFTLKTIRESWLNILCQGLTGDSKEKENKFGGIIR